MKLHDIIANHVVIAASEQAVLAKSLSEDAPEPYVCWRHDADHNGVHSGQYFTDKDDAEWCFAARSFEWFEDNAPITMIEDDVKAPQMQAEEHKIINPFLLEEVVKRFAAFLSTRPITNDKVRHYEDMPLSQWAENMYESLTGYKFGEGFCCINLGGRGHRRRDTAKALNENFQRFGVPHKVLVDDGSSLHEVNQQAETDK